MNIYHTIIFCSISGLCALPVMGSDQRQKSMQYASGLSQNDIDRLCTEAQRPYAEKYPLTMALIHRELQHSSAAIMKERAAKAQHIECDQKTDVITQSSILELKATFDETMKDPLAQKIMAFAAQRDYDRFTEYETIARYDPATQRIIRSVNCSTNLFEVSTLERFLAEASKKTGEKKQF